MIARNRTLAIFAGAIGLGVLTGITMNPVMKPPPEQPWKDRLEKNYYPAPSYHFVDAGPEDLSPRQGWRDYPDPGYLSDYAAGPVYEPAVYADYVYEPLPPVPEYEPEPIEPYRPREVQAALGSAEQSAPLPSPNRDRAARAAAAAREAALTVLEAQGLLPRDDPSAEL